MAVLHRKEEKIQAVLGRLPKKYTQEQFVEMFIKLYSKDWGKIKSAYIKQSQDKEPGSIINMPKPEIYLKQVLTNYLQQADEIKTEVKATTKPVEVVVEENQKPKEEIAPVVKPKKATKKEEIALDSTEEVKKTKAAPKKKAEAEKTSDKPVKAKAVAKKDETEAPTEKPAKAKAVAKKKDETTEEKPKPAKKTVAKK